MLHLLLAKPNDDDVDGSLAFSFGIPAERAMGKIDVRIVRRHEIPQQFNLLALGYGVSRNESHLNFSSVDELGSLKIPCNGLS